jgi:hypothetical protein
MAQIPKAELEMLRRNNAVLVNLATMVDSGAQVRIKELDQRLKDRADAHAETKASRKMWTERASELGDKVDMLEACLTEIRDVAAVSEGVEFYVMLAQQGLDGEFKR